MSTKTSFKRIALVAASALAIAGFSAVPANAVAGNGTFMTVPTNTVNTGATTAPIPSGTAATFTIDLDDTVAAIVATDAVSIIATVTAGPANKVITSTCTFTPKTVTGLTLTVQDATTGELGIVATAGVADPGGTNVPLFDLSCPTTIGGAYKVTLTQGALVTKVGFGTQVFTAPADETDGLVIVSGTNVTQGSTVSTTAGAAVVNGQSTVLVTFPTHTNAQTPFIITSSGVGSISAPSTIVGGGAATATGGTAGNFSAGVTLTPAASTALASIAVLTTSAVAGVQTITVAQFASGTGIKTTVTSATITWGDASAVSAGFTAAASFIGDGTTLPLAVGTPSLAYSKTAQALTSQAASGATIAINVKDGSNAALSGVALSATISGPGLITLTAGTGVGATGTVRAASLTAAQMTTAIARIGVSADGTSGTSIITVSAGSTVLFTKEVTFFGSVATLTATQVLKVAPATTAGGTLGTAVAAPAGTSVATTPAVIIVAKDSVGNVVPNLVISGKTSDATVISSATVVESNGLGLGDGEAGAGSYNASVTTPAAAVSGKSATVTFRIIDPAGDGTTFITSAPVTFTLGGKASTATFSAALDANSYTAGAPATLTLTAKDASGNPIFDQDLTLFAGLGTAPVWSKSVVGITPSTGSIAFKSGVKAITGFAPALGGDFSMSAGLDSLVVTAGGSVTAAATVEGDQSSSLALDAANAATDAANNAYDEAQNATQAASDALAAVTALAAQVKSLIASVKKLTAAVAKLKK